MEEAELIRNITTDYDPEGDVLYISFGKPQEADDSDVTEEGVIIRLKEGKIVGLTIQRQQKDAAKITPNSKRTHLATRARALINP